MSPYLYRIRDRFHPLNRLRCHRLTRTILHAVDVPVWARLPGVQWKVRVRLVRHACYFVLSESVEPGVARLIRFIVRRCGVRSFWDVGANIGYYTWLLKSIAPAAQVRMFEPEPDNLRLVCATICRNNLAGITVREVAASDTRGSRPFSRDWISGSTGGIRDNSLSYSEREWRVAPGIGAAATVLLDDERAGAGPVDLIKIDVEGHEEAVIRGALETIRSDRPILIIECFHGGNEMISVLRSLDYVFLDAEQMTSVVPSTCNFLALPKGYHTKIGELRAPHD